MDISDEFLQGIRKLDGAEQGKSQEFFRLCFHQRGNSHEKGTLHKVPINNHVLDSWIHENAECDRRPNHVLHLIGVEFHFVQMHQKGYEAGKGLHSWLVEGVVTETKLPPAVQLHGQKSVDARCRCLKT